MRFCAPLRLSPAPALQWIEATSRFQIPSFHIVGLASQEVHEARERVRAAIEASGWEFPRRKVVVNLSPADVRKRGTSTDLALALAVHALNREGRLPDEVICASGELGLEGNLKPTGRVLHALASCRLASVRRLLLPQEELSHARQLQARFPELREIAVAGCATLAEAWRAINEPGAPPLRNDPVDEAAPEFGESRLTPPDETLRRILAAAIAGRHHCLLLGPRGSGKSQALEWAASLLPPPSVQDRLQSELLHESRGERKNPGPLVVRVGPLIRPAGLLGQLSATEVRPGLLALAHQGVLIADEIPEWPRDSRECLRGPMEEGVVRLQRAQASVEFAACFRILASGNFCECGGLPADLRADDVPVDPCRCALAQRLRYANRLSGPFLDRTDLLVVLRRLAPSRPTRSSGDQESVYRTRMRLLREYGELPSLMAPTVLEEQLDALSVWKRWEDGRAWPSLRSRHRVASVGLTLAAGDDRAPHERHFVEAALYRPERWKR